jgi:CRISPR type I-E-associated protein CasA/Cse1
VSVPAFNVLTDPWIPLDDGRGRAVYASYVDLMSGTRDASDLVHPRDDCRFFARMLLSALTQALFRAANAKELRERIEAPLRREAVLSRVEKVKADFELVGPDAFMQSALTPTEIKSAKDPAEASEPATPSLFLDVPRKSRHLLFRPASPCDSVCMPCAVVLVYGIQAFAMEDGKSGFGLRGKSPSVRGAPAATTLILDGGVRASTWANVLHEQRPPELGYAVDVDRPWRQMRTEKPKGSPFGLLEGLFWQPRAFHLASSVDGACFACGAVGPRLAPVAWRSKSRAVEGALFRHPWSPVRENLKKREIRYVRLGSDRPAWTGIVDLLTAVAGGKGKGDEIIHAAPAVRQWYDLRRTGSASLMVLDVGTTRRDRATPASRVCESFPLSLRLADTDVADAVRDCVGDAEKALDALRIACVRLHMKTRPGDRLSGQRRKRASKEKNLLHDTTAAFWQATELAFWAVYEAAIEGDGAMLGREQSAFRARACRTAVELFDAWSGASLSDPSRVAIVADAGAYLRRSLPWPSM